VGPGRAPRAACALLAPIYRSLKGHGHLHVKGILDYPNLDLAHCRCKGARCGLCFPVVLLEEHHKKAQDYLNRWTYLCESCNTGLHSVVNLDAGGTGSAPARAADRAPLQGTLAAAKRGQKQEQKQQRRAILKQSDESGLSSDEDQPLAKRMHKAAGELHLPDCFWGAGTAAKATGWQL
jgi:hypothetical protein